MRDDSDFYHETYTYKPLYIKGNQGKFDGIVHEYTEVTEGPKPGGAWPDYALVAIMGPDTPIDIGELKWPSK